jgi:hypothetical protein
MTHEHSRAIACFSAQHASVGEPCGARARAGSWFSRLLSRAGFAAQHPALGVEPKPTLRTPSGPHHVQTRARTLPLSAAICVDLDYADVIKCAKRAGGVLNVPANDWRVFERVHHRTAVWAAAMSGVPIPRATGHGISSVYDGAGPVLASQSSLKGPVTLVVDVPVAPSSS